MDISAYQHMNIRMSTRGKRPLRNLTPSDKVKAIERIHNGETKASVSRDIGVPESTLRGWCKNEQKLKFMCRQLRATDQISPMTASENPPEKRTRFDNHLQTHKYQTVSSSFNEFGYNRLPLNGLSFPANSGNAFFEKITINEIMKKHITTNVLAKQPVDNISIQMSSLMDEPFPSRAIYNSQLSAMQNLNFLSFLSSNMSELSNVKADGGTESLDVMNNNMPAMVTADEAQLYRRNGNASTNSCSGGSNKINENNQTCSTNNASSSLFVRKWAKDPAADKYLTHNTNQTDMNTTATTTGSYLDINSLNNDSNNNIVKDNKHYSLPVENAAEVLNFPPALPPGILQIPNVNYKLDPENVNNTALLEWCKVFNASITFLALTVAAAANSSMSTGSSTSKKEDNILYNELTNATNMFDASNNSTPLISSDTSNDSYFDSEPEDLSVRSTNVSKLTTPSASPIKSEDYSSCLPLPSDTEH